jgi:uncharacterized protein (DUF58 family)
MTFLRDIPAPTLRLFAIALALAVPLALGSLTPLFLGVAAVAAIVLVVSVAVDGSSASRADRLVASRQHEARLYLGADNEIRLVVENRDRRPLSIRVRDTPPAAFQSSAIFFVGQVDQTGSASFSYTTRPATRGEFRFGDLTLRWRTPLGLLWLQKTIPAGETVPVYPNVLDLHRYDLMAHRGMLAEVGLRRTRLYGRGTEFESLREYQRDDDYRRINWKATARRHAPISTLYETDRSQRVIIALDLGRMMQTRVGELSRLDYAVNAALMLAYVALVRGDRVGMLGFADSIKVYVGARRGREHFYGIVEQLYAIRAQTVEPDYASAFARLRGDLRGRAMVALFTDLSDRQTARTVARHLMPLARYHLPLCVTLRDPALDARSGQFPNDSRQVYEKVVALLLVEERLTVLEELRRAGVETVDAAADQLTLATINRYLQIKDRARL